MTTETTALITATNPVSGQRTAFQALAELAAQHPQLPAPYLTVHEPYSGFSVKVDFQVNGTEFEAWREALGIDPEDVVLHITRSYTWVAADIARDGIRIHLSGFTIPLTAEQASAPRDTTEVTA